MNANPDIKKEAENDQNEKNNFEIPGDISINTPYPINAQFISQIAYNIIFPFSVKSAVINTSGYTSLANAML